MWANRTIAAAADARKYGANGLLGIHWRTFETSLTLQALARVAWEPELGVQQLYTDFCHPRVWLSCRREAGGGDPDLDR